jgi:hypothetical protein
VKSRRDAGLTALFLGFFAAAWFSWAQATESALRITLFVGSIVSCVVAIIGAVIGFRRPSAESALHDRARYRRYGIIVGIEFASAGIGAAVLGIFGAAEYIPLWVCLVVGVHFFPLAPVLDDAGLRPLGAAMIVVGVAGLVIALTTSVAASTVVGIGAGLLLLAYAVVAVTRAMRVQRSSRQTAT